MNRAVRRELSRIRSKLKVEEGQGGFPSQKKHGVCGLADYYLWGAESRDISRWEDVGGVLAGTWGLPR